MSENTYGKNMNGNFNSQNSDESNDFGEQIRRDLEEMGDYWKMNLVETFTKRIREHEALIKSRQNSGGGNNAGGGSAQQQAEIRELKVKLYDCWAAMANHEKELQTAKLTLEEILQAYSNLNEKYQEQKKDLHWAKDELAKCGIGLVKNEPDEESEDSQDQDIQERARLAIDQMDKTTKSIRQFEQQRVQAESQTNRAQTHRAQIAQLQSKMTPQTSSTNSFLPNSMLNNQLNNQMNSQLNNHMSNSISSSHSSNMLHREDGIIDLESHYAKKRKPYDDLDEGEEEYFDNYNDMTNENDIDNSLNSRVIVPLSEEKIDQLFFGVSLEAFAGRLLRSYFSKKELTVKECNVLGKPQGGGMDASKKKLDPYRVELIKNHVFTKNGGESEKLWQSCVTRMNIIMNRLRKRETIRAINQINRL